MENERPQQSEQSEFSTTPLLDFYNALVQELEQERADVKAMRQEKGPEAIQSDVAYSYRVGHVVGFELAVDALRAHIIAQAVEERGEFTPEHLSNPQE